VYPPVVYALFLLADGDALRFQIPILILAFSDAFGALVGKTYGRRTYRVMDQLRSLEGSLTFFVVAFLATHLPLLLSAQTGRLEAVLVAVVIALLATGFEAVSLGGSDNLIVPLGVFVLLERLLPLPATELGAHAAVLAALLLGVALTARWQRLSASASIAALLVGYAVWTLAGAGWLWPLLVFYLTHNLLLRLPPWAAVARADHPPHERERHEISAVFYISLVPVGLAAAYAQWPLEALFLAYLTAVGAGAAIAWGTLLPSRWLRGLREYRPPQPEARSFGGVGELALPLLGAALPLAPYLFAPPPHPLDAARTSLVLGLALGGMLLKAALGRTVLAQYRAADGTRLSRPRYGGEAAVHAGGVRGLNLDRLHALCVLAAAGAAAGAALWLVGR
jgi:hypothetical protein